ncbi:putative nucleotide-diphospho-sugar transferase [bacterium]|nr:putative nucleotide-diphospho-sugar transferase [bacterium]
MDLKILTVCNEPYVNIMVNLIQTLNDYHPEIPIEMLALNLTEESKEKFTELHDNIEFIDDDYDDFANFEEERAYCESCRTWNIKKILMETNSNVLYLDGDVYLEDSIEELIEFFEEVDFCARMKVENPYRFNAGMIYVKNTEENIAIVEEWEHATLSHGWVWLSAQNELGDTLEKHRDDVIVKTFPKKFDGIDTNRDSVIVHMKGPTKKKR